MGQHRTKVAQRPVVELPPAIRLQEGHDPLRCELVQVDVADQRNQHLNDRPMPRRPLPFVRPFLQVTVSERLELQPLGGLDAFETSAIGRRQVRPAVYLFL